jgi:hypothetical protein
MSVLLGVKEDLGGIKATATATSALLANHIGVDTVVQAQLRTDVSTLQLGAARQRGFLAAIGTVGTVLGAGVGYMIDVLRHH